MFWAAILLGVSSYSWYMVFNYMTHATVPDFGTGLAGLFLLGLLPACLGFNLNRALLVSGPTVIRLIISNALLYVLVTGLIVLGSLTTADYLFWNPVQPLHWSVYLFPSFWLLLSWLYGTYFVFKSVGMTPVDRPTNIKTMETSLALVMPAVFILTFMDFPSPLLMLLIACWFMALALTLAVEGLGITESSTIRYDIVIFHALVPPLAAVLLLVLAFFGQIRSLLQTAQTALLALLGLLFQLLELLFPPLPENNSPLPEMPPIPISGGGAEKVQEPSSWFLLFFIALGLLLLIPIMRGLIKLFKLRLGPIPKLPQRTYPRAGALLPMLRWLAALVGSLFKLGLALGNRVAALVKLLGQKLKSIVHRWLPAKTPGQKIFRTYDAFLRLGRRLGCPRKAHETPLEYAGRLQTSTGKQHFPAAEIGQLTSLFQEACYSSRPVNWQQAEKSQTLLKTIANRLKN